MKVLVSAFACDPFRGSEEAVGWGWVRTLARSHEVHVITAAFQRDAIERWESEHGPLAPRVRLHFVPPRALHYKPTPAWTRIESSVLKPIMNLAYTQWMRDAGRLATQLDAHEDFDLVHLVTYVGFRFPGTYWQLEKPFVWGPIGGLENTPWRLLPALGWRGAIYYAGRNAINAVQRRVLPGVRRSMRRADALIAATRGIQRGIRRYYRRDAHVICEVGMTAVGEDGRSAGRGVDEPLRLIWSGLHLPGKALPLLLEALESIDPACSWELVVLGDGPCSPAWRAEAAARGLAARVRWTGAIPREHALGEMRHAHALVITSLKDLTSTVLVEALSLGLPVLCPDHCGFADAVDASCGRLLRIDTLPAFRAALAGAILELAGDEPLRRRLADGAVARAAGYTWDYKAAQIEAVYQAALEGWRRAC